MTDLRESNRERELALLVDVSSAGNSSRACQVVDEFVGRLAAQHPTGVLVDLNAGDLLLTRGVLSKIKQQIQRTGAMLGTVYATVPQTQQAALDEGLYVKEKLVSEWTPIRQALPQVSAPEPPKATGVTPPSGLKTSERDEAVELPDFRRERPAVRPEPKPAVEPLGEPMEQKAAPDDLETEPLSMEQAATLPQELVIPDATFETLYLRQTLRSGQTVRFNGNVVIVGDVHAGSEVTAGGDILVWGELRGIAHAGAQGNYQSEIRAMKIEALQLRIADYIARRPDRIYYHKEGVESALSPEVARVADGEIKIFKTALPRH